MKRILLLLIAAASIHAQTWGAWNGVTVGSSAGNISRWDGTTIGTVAGNISQWNTLNAPAPLGPAVVDGTSAVTTGSAITTVSTVGGHLLNYNANDHLWLAAYSTATTCSGFTFTITDSAGSTWSPVAGSSCVLNQWSGTGVMQQFEVTSTSAASGVSIQIVFSTNTSDAGFVVAQMRDTANSAADTQATCDGNTAGNNCSGSSPLSAIGVPSNVTITNAVSFILTAIHPSTGQAITPTINGCFGVTGTVIPHTPTGAGQVIGAQYAITSATATSNCLFDISSAASKISKLAVYH